MRIALSLGLLLGTIATAALAADPVPLKPGYTLSFNAGTRDARGIFMGGTEMRLLTPYQGRLYAGNGYWEDKPGDEGQQGAQVLVLDGPDGEWRVDHSFSAKLPRGARRHLAVAALIGATFTNDGDGRPLPQPVSMLLAGTWDLSGYSQVFSRDDASGAWTAMTMAGARVTGQIQQVRSLATHRDSVTGADLVIVGNDPYGLYRGTYDATKTGRIAWSEEPELSIADLHAPAFPGIKPIRVMALAECNGQLFAAIGQQLYRRTDGEKPGWELVFTNPNPGYSESGLRGLTAIPNPSGSGQVLLAAVEGNAGRILRFDPQSKEAVTEYDMSRELGKAWNTRVSYTIAAYNNMAPLPNSSDLLIGFEAFIPKNAPVPAGHERVDGAEAGAWYLIRMPTPVMNCGRSAQGTRSMARRWSRCGALRPRPSLMTRTGSISPGWMPISTRPIIPPGSFAARSAANSQAGPDPLFWAGTSKPDDDCGEPDRSLAATAARPRDRPDLPGRRRDRAGAAEQCLWPHRICRPAACHCSKARRHGDPDRPCDLAARHHACRQLLPLDFRLHGRQLCAALCPPAGL